MKDLIKRIEKFNSDREWGQFHSPENLAKSISIEAGELLECFQWDKHYDKENVVDELADVMMYALMLSNRIDVDIYEVIENKLKLNEKRYPIEDAKGNNKKYTEFR